MKKIKIFIRHNDNALFVSYDDKNLIRLIHDNHPEGEDKVVMTDKKYVEAQLQLHRFDLACIIFKE